MKLCPICAKASPDPVFRPFCSRRCADEDLSNWLTGHYAVPAPANEEDTDPDLMGYEGEGLPRH